jgi:chitin disaccharide deacetylase
MTAPEPEAARRIWLCADDYGISKGVNTAIRDLVVRGRINATSVMVVAPAFQRSEAVSLSILNTGSSRVAIGLHITLTAPFRPLSPGFAPLHDGAFLSIGNTLRAAFLRQLKPEKIAVEVGAQLKAFITAFGKPPDFVDGHQHVHLLPQVRDAVLTVVRDTAPAAWLRQCRRSVPLGKRFGDRKGLLLDGLSSGFRRHARKLGLATNPAFAGTYDFDADPHFAALFPSFIEHLPAGGLVMCHPGFVDEELQRLDPLTFLREREYAYFADDAFPRLLAARGVTLS